MPPLPSQPPFPLPSTAPPCLSLTSHPLPSSYGLPIPSSLQQPLPPTLSISPANSFLDAHPNPRYVSHMPHFHGAMAARTRTRGGKPKARCTTPSRRCRRTPRLRRRQYRLVLHIQLTHNHNGHPHLPHPPSTIHPTTRPLSPWLLHLFLQSPSVPPRPVACISNINEIR